MRIEYSFTGGNMSIGWTEILLILFIILILFGAKRLPDIGRSIGHSIREFRKALRHEEEDKTD